ncbi:hypothetical protein IWW37_004867 [Coemansia sp. RSA 2050]|nr:hypothetical protein IWW37_004867 [Coemansia sp. RSA 2050]KAJ2731089.1 hypothetical protein IW152_004795 [Coemansia sp. BCRC 34962]
MGMDGDALPLFELDLGAVSDVERQACGEFFAGKANKTPERYMAIRNYMVEAWRAVQPLYLTKIRARVGLRNCGDVNAIGRVHAFLEHARIINVGAERRQQQQQQRRQQQQQQRRRRRRPASAESGDDDDDGGGGGWRSAGGGSGAGGSGAGGSGRRRRVRGEGGGWVFQDEHCGGRVISHDVVERRADDADADYSCSGSGSSSGSEGGGAGAGPVHKRPRGLGEFRLVPCRALGEGRRPFRVEVAAAALALMDLHAHLVHTEVIGLLGGAYDAAAGVVRVDAAFPCSSTGTATECEMDPASEVDARRAFALQGRCAVGWFHSHPTFDAEPSVRDIRSQHAYQALCRRAGDGAEPFVGAIVSPPGAPGRAYGVSDITVFHVGGDGAPYRLPFAVVARGAVPAEAAAEMAALAERHAGTAHSVDLARRFRRCEPMTVLEKLVVSLRSHWGGGGGSSGGDSDGATRQWDDFVALTLRPLLQARYCKGPEPAAAAPPPAAARRESSSPEPEPEPEEGGGSSDTQSE